uniref:Uncharacterized protein n=1 Tax=Arundo donax TaxID=35708 RepID=A0A0A9HAR3_ARUDO
MDGTMLFSRFILGCTLKSFVTLWLCALVPTLPFPYLCAPFEGPWSLKGVSVFL